MKLLVIVGPTATGKTRLGVEIAHEVGSEIVSADSRQVYRGLDIGTGKDLAEYSALDPPVPYHLIDIADPRENYTLFHYQRDCHDVLRALAENEPFGNGTIPVTMVGGSGLYVESILRGFRLADVDEDPRLRRDLGRLGREELERRLLEASPAIHGRTDCSSRRRLIRGLEIAAAEQHGLIRHTQPLGIELDVRILSIAVERRVLRRRIADRLEHRLQSGMVDEVRGLLDDGVKPARLKRLGLEYREIGAYLAGRKTYRTMASDLETAIGQFAKRQQTWFGGMPRRGLPVQRIESGDLAHALKIVTRWDRATGDR